MKFIPTKRFNKDKYDEVERPDFQLKFELTNSFLDVNIDWTDDFDLDELVELMVPISTGDIIGAIFAELSEMLDEDMVEVLREKLMEAKKVGEVSETNDTEEAPLVQPIHGIQHLMHLNSGEME